MRSLLFSEVYRSDLLPSRLGGDLDLDGDLLLSDRLLLLYLLSLRSLES